MKFCGGKPRAVMTKLVEGCSWNLNTYGVGVVFGSVWVPLFGENSLDFFYPKTAPEV